VGKIIKSIGGKSMRTIEVLIRDDGSIKVHASGFKGKSCEDALKIISEKLGEVISEKKTSEWYQGFAEEEKCLNRNLSKEDN